MNIYKVKRILFISLMITILVLSSMQMAYAASASELQQQQNELDKQIEKTASEIAGVKEQMTEQLTKINQLNSEISNYDDEISDLQTKIDNLTTPEIFVFLNAPLPIDSKPSFNFKEVTSVKAKASSPITFKLEGKIIFLIL